MSVQFGRWNFDGKPVDRDYLDKVNTVLEPYGPDGAGSYSKENVSIFYHAFHTTPESRREAQPHVTGSGAVITWDGRLDNREELIRESSEVLTATSTDIAIVEATYERWGTSSFAKLIGDWALAIWDAEAHSLILAKDPVGARHLYYFFDEKQVTWSTTLDPLVLFAGKSFTLCEEYIAGCLSLFPATHLTPYRGIHSVPPSSSVLIRAGNHLVSKYWDFDPSKRIHYRNDADYEEHFRAAFREAVRRRLRSGNPVLAELSGGMDSSSIVSMADTIIAEGGADCPRLDTVSYYDDSEPNWNERPYFAKVEERRGRTGCHINIGHEEPLKFDWGSTQFAAMPGSDGGSEPSRLQKLTSECRTSHGNRVVLSGIGGDEVMGGVPTPMPELQDLFASGEFKAFVRRVKVWALNKRIPWLYLVVGSLRAFLPWQVRGSSALLRLPSWLNSKFAQRNRAALQGYETRVRLFGPLPSFQTNLIALTVLRQQLHCTALPPAPGYEKRYPYLDRELLEFAYAIPREQSVRPGQRRSLMRRALIGIVPDEILNRKRKAFIERGPRANISREWPSLVRFTDHMIMDRLGFVNHEQFVDALRSARNGQEVALVTIVRTLALEVWLRNASSWNVLNLPEVPRTFDQSPAGLRGSNANSQWQAEAFNSAEKL